MLRHKLFLCLLLLFAGCTKEMDIQNKLIFQTHLAPKAPEGTITTSGQDATGARDLQNVSSTADLALLKRGEERFNIHCTPCHDRTGSGNGLVVNRGFPRPVSFADQKLRDLSDQTIFDVISNGYQTMAGYKTFISTADRVAIVGYVRVLQLARSFPSDQLEPSDLEKLGKPGDR